MTTDIKIFAGAMAVRAAEVRARKLEQEQEAARLHAEVAEQNERYLREMWLEGKEEEGC